MVTQSWYVLVCLGDLSRAFLSEVRINMSLSDEHENHEQALASESSELFFFFSGKSEEFFYVFFPSQGVGVFRHGGSGAGAVFTRMWSQGATNYESPNHVNYMK